MARYNIYYKGTLVQWNTDKRSFMDAHPGEFTLKEWENMRDIRAEVRGYQVLRIRDGETEEARLDLLNQKADRKTDGVLYNEWDRVTRKLYPLVKGTNIKITWSGAL